MERSDFVALQNRVFQLEKRLKFVLTGGTASVVLVALLFIALPAVRPESEQKLETLRVRSLIVVDEKGVERLRIAAPVPDAIVAGLVQHRRSPANGIQLNDANGEERGGYGMLDDGTLVLCFDVKLSEATCMYVMPSGEAGVEVGDARSRTRATLTTLPEQGVGLVLTDAAGKERAALRLGPDGSPVFELKDAEGKIVHKAP